MCIHAQEDIKAGIETLKKEKVTGADTTGWKTGGKGTLNFSQVSLTHWAAGGENNVSLLGSANLFANYKKGKLVWDNILDVTYGMIKQGDADFQKNDDNVSFLSKAGREARKNWYYSGLLNMRSQITRTFTFEGTIMSEFLAPAYIQLALGMDYKKKDVFSLFLSPAAGKLTVVRNQDLADAGAYGVDPAVYNETDSTLVTKGMNYRYEFGAYMLAKLKIDLVENVTLDSKLELFNNYTDKNTGNRANIDVNWESRIFLKVNKFISASIFTHIIYDDDTKLEIDLDNDGVTDKMAPRTQFKEVFGIGLSYKF